MSKPVRAVVIGVVVAFVVSFLLSLLPTEDGRSFSLSTLMVGLFAGIFTAYILGNLSGNRSVADAGDEQRKQALAAVPPAGKMLLYVQRQGFVAKLAGLNIFIDGRNVAQLKSPRFTLVTLPARPCALSASFGGLAGAQSRGTEKRISRLEEELPKRVAEMREELKRGIATLEAYARREIDSLNERLRGETAERDKGDEQLAAKADVSAKALRKEIAGLDERSTAAQRELRQHLLDQTKRLDDEIQRRSDDLAASLTRAVEELRSEKADRKAVAGILHEVAMRLTDEFALPLGTDKEP